MAGLSRKGMLGAITGRDVEHRQVASAAAALMATQNGASLLRVHDVAETVDALAVLKRRPQRAVERNGLHQRFLVLRFGSDNAVIAPPTPNSARVPVNTMVRIAMDRSAVPVSEK
jgi:hypothetical protein